jgi:hypothetical protein
MQATAHCAIVGLLAVMLGSCAWQPTPSDRPHVLSEMADTPANDKPKCQSPGGACQPAMAGQRILLIRGLMDYMPGISPMTSLKARLANEGYDVTLITHMTGMPSLVTVRERSTPCGMLLTLRAITLT